MVVFWSLYRLFRCLGDHAVFIFRMKLGFREMLHSENEGNIFLRNVKKSLAIQNVITKGTILCLSWLVHTVRGTAV